VGLSSGHTWVCLVATRKSSLEIHTLQSFPQKQASRAPDKIQL